MRILCKIKSTKDYEWSILDSGNEPQMLISSICAKLEQKIPFLPGLDESMTVLTVEQLLGVLITNEDSELSPCKQMLGMEAAMSLFGSLTIATLSALLYVYMEMFPDQIMIDNRKRKEESVVDSGGVYAMVEKIVGTGDNYWFALLCAEGLQWSSMVRILLQLLYRRLMDQCVVNARVYAAGSIPSTLLPTDIPMSYTPSCFSSAPEDANKLASSVYAFCKKYEHCISIPLQVAKKEEISSLNQRTIDMQTQTEDTIPSRETTVAPVSPTVAKPTAVVDSDLLLFHLRHKKSSPQCKPPAAVEPTPCVSPSPAPVAERASSPGIVTPRNESVGEEDRWRLFAKSYVSMSSMFRAISLQ